MGLERGREVPRMQCPPRTSVSWVPELQAESDSPPQSQQGVSTALREPGRAMGGAGLSESATVPFLVCVGSVLVTAFPGPRRSHPKVLWRGMRAALRFQASGGASGPCAALPTLESRIAGGKGCCPGAVPAFSLSSKSL